MSSWTVKFLKPARGVHTNHSSKTYQLAGAEMANSVCFQRFLGNIAGFGPSWCRISALSGRSRSSCGFSPDAPAAPAGSPPTLPQHRRVLPRRSRSSCGFSPTLPQHRRVLPRRSRSSGGFSPDAPSAPAPAAGGFPVSGRVLREGPSFRGTCCGRVRWLGAGAAGGSGESVQVLREGSSFRGRCCGRVLCFGAGCEGGGLGG